MELTTSLGARRGLTIAGMTLGALLVVTAWLTLSPLSHTSDRLDYLEHQRLAPSAALHELRASLTELHAYELGQIMHAGNTAEAADYDRRMDDTRQRLERAWKRYAASTPESDEARRRTSFKHKLDSYLELRRRIAETVRAGDKTQAEAMSTGQAQQQRDALFTELSLLIAQIDQRAGPDAR
ncbi:MCP four helix bundle domain-containing protein [Xanthomonas arboricola]|uniref:MCP four helix bundle domain-containing protein n=1 Tax=Xanthomonas arboricola TaxID=56448 RepID=UPI00155932FD|nr:MCP four helix bundle domain-containing protein [Xanthomonas arboricola]